MNRFAVGKCAFDDILGIESQNLPTASRNPVT